MRTTLRRASVARRATPARSRRCSASRRAPSRRRRRGVWCGMEVGGGTSLSGTRGAASPSRPWSVGGCLWASGDNNNHPLHAAHAATAGTHPGDPSPESTASPVLALPFRGPFLGSSTSPPYSTRVTSIHAPTCPPHCTIVSFTSARPHPPHYIITVSHLTSRISHSIFSLHCIHSCRIPHL